MSSKVEAAIKPLNFVTAVFRIRGTSPYVQNKFSAKAMQMMHAKHEAGSQANKGKKREARDFKADYKAAMYQSAQGWHGIPAPSFRNAMISACRLAGFKMTHAKLSVFVKSDGYDKDKNGHCPLVKIVKGKPFYSELPVRNATGVVDLRARPMWDEGWEADVTVKFDADQFSVEDVANLLNRAGQQVGVGEGRPDSKESNGMGWGTFEVLGKPASKGKKAKKLVEPDAAGKTA